MKKTKLLLLLFFPLSTFCSTIDSLKVVDTVKASKWNLGFSFSPDYCYRTLKSDAAIADLKEIRDTLEVPKFGYTFGVNIIYYFRKKIVLETGILFSDKGERTKKLTFQNLPAGQSPNYYAYNFHYYYLDIPLKVDYYLLTKKIKMYLTAGLSCNILLTQKTTLREGHDNTEVVRNASNVDTKPNRINVAVLFGAGLNYKVNEKLDLKVEPIYSRSITPINGAPIKSYLYSFGLNLGITHKF